jgi:hypothetical protein
LFIITVHVIIIEMALGAEVLVISFQASSEVYLVSGVGFQAQ